MNTQVLRAASLAVICSVLSMISTAQTKNESVTVIREGPGGETQIITSEIQGGPPGTAVVPAAPASTPAGKEPDVARKARIVVIPAVIAQEKRRRIDRELNERFGITDPGAWEQPGYTSYLVDALVNTRKFEILEREEIKALVKEIEFGESELVAMQKAVQIGNMVGADYIVIPEINYVESVKEEKAVPYLGGTQVSLKMKLSTAVRTVSVATGKIIASNVNELEKAKKMKGNSSEPQKAERMAVLELMGEAFKESTMAEAANIADAAYPIRVMGVHGTYVMLNRGRGSILPGEELKVFSAGEVIIDPDTKENLGFQETYIGKIRVTEVDQKTCKAEILEKVGEIQRLSICRRIAPPSLTPQLKPAETAPNIE